MLGFFQQSLVIERRGQTLGQRGFTDANGTFDGEVRGWGAPVQVGVDGLGLPYQGLFVLLSRAVWPGAS